MPMCFNFPRVESSRALTQREFEFSEEKIRENFSNYSAFHHRSIFLQRLIDQAGTPSSSSSSPTMRELLPAEFSVVENAVFTEPDDQSVWWYHQFLLTLAARDVRDSRIHAQEGAREDGKRRRHMHIGDHHFHIVDVYLCILSVAWL